MFNGTKVQGLGIGVKYIFCDLLDGKQNTFARFVLFLNLILFA